MPRRLRPASKTGAPKAVAKTVTKPVASKPAVVAAKPVVAPPRVEEPKKVLTQHQVSRPANSWSIPRMASVRSPRSRSRRSQALLELFVINFMKDKMTLRVPTAKVANVGMRKLSEPALVKRALETLKGRARIKRTMWSRRAQEYEAKINSGDIVAIAEVVRDLYRSDSQPEQSYSERQLYEAALDRLSREIAVVQHVTETEAVKEIEGQLAKSPLRRGAGRRKSRLTPMRILDGDDAELLRTRRRKRFVFFRIVLCPGRKAGLFKGRRHPGAKYHAGPDGRRVCIDVVGALYVTASIRDDFDPVACLHLGVEVQTIQDAEALGRMIDPGHPVR